MTQNHTPLDDQWKNDVEKLLDHCILDAFDEKRISYVDMKRAAAFIINTIDPLTSHDEIIAMIEKMQKEWPIFEKALTHVHEKKKPKMSRKS